MDKEMIDAIKKAEKNLLNMPEKKFQKLMEESEDSYLTKTLMELGAFDYIEDLTVCDSSPGFSKANFSSYDFEEFQFSSLEFEPKRTSESNLEVTEVESNCLNYDDFIAGSPDFSDFIEFGDENIGIIKNKKISEYNFSVKDKDSEYKWVA